MLLLVRKSGSPWLEHTNALSCVYQPYVLSLTHSKSCLTSSKMPRIWIDYLTIFTHPKCPAFLSYSHARRTFDRALRTLPGSLHPRIWRLYLLHASKIGGPYLTAVWGRYLSVDSTLTEYYVELLLNQPQPAAGQSALRAAKLLLKLSLQASKGQYKSPEGKSAFHLLTMFLAAAERFPDEIGLDLEDVPASSLKPADEEDEPSGQPVESSKQAEEDLGATLDVEDQTKMDVELVVRLQGIKPFPDQAGKLYVGLATFWIKKGDFDHVRRSFG
jgi:pre-mRNA-splicing factor SYF1